MNIKKFKYKKPTVYQLVENKSLLLGLCSFIF